MFPDPPSSRTFSKLNVGGTPALECYRAATVTTTVVLSWLSPAAATVTQSPIITFMSTMRKPRVAAQVAAVQQ